MVGILVAEVQTGWRLDGRTDGCKVSTVTQAYGPLRGWNSVSHPQRHSLNTPVSYDQLAEQLPGLLGGLMKEWDEDAFILRRHSGGRT